MYVRVKLTCYSSSLLQDHKKLQNLLLTEKELKYGSKPTPKRTHSLNRKSNGYYANGNGNGFMTPSPRRVSVGSATPELLTPRSCSGRQNSYFKETRRLSTAPLNFVAISKEDTLSTFTSISGSERESPPSHCWIRNLTGNLLLTSYVYQNLHLLKSFAWLENKNFVMWVKWKFLFSQERMEKHPIIRGWE